MDTPLQRQYRLGLVTGGSAIPEEESPSKHLIYAFVDVVELLAEGAVLETGLALSPAEGLDLMVFDEWSKRWHMHYCRPIRWDPGQGDSTLCTVEFLAHPGPKIAKNDLRFLMSTQLFRFLPQRAFLELINSLTRNDYPEGSTLLHQGDKGERLYIVQQGNVELVVHDGASNHRIDERREGDVLGEVTLLTGEPALHTAIAMTDCVVWQLEKETFHDLLEKYDDLRLFMTELVTKHFETASQLAERSIGKFQVKELLGKGGWGLVFRGEHSILGLPAAVKMLKHSMALDGNLTESFRNEAKVIAAFSHRNIVQVYDIEETYGTLFIVMEYLEGQSLQELLAARGKLTCDRTVSILIQTLEALDYAHRQGVVHRDIKPDNIYLLAGDHVKVLDFGLACAVDTEDHSLPGTVNYAPPEQIEGDPVGPPADIYAAGIMAYEMVTGTRPYPDCELLDLMDLHCNEDIPDPKLALPDIPEQLRTFILKACQRDPAARFASAAEALRALGWVGATKIPRKVAVLTLSCEGDKVHQIAGLLEEFSEKASALGVQMKMMTLDDD